jgi:hypothetical protein
LIKVNAEKPIKDTTQLVFAECFPFLLAGEIVSPGSVGSRGFPFCAFLTESEA